MSASTRTLPLAPDALWASVAPTGMLWAHWEGDNALFHAETGETHLLSALPTLLLEMLAEQRLHTREIYELSAQACGVAVDAAWEQKITAVLRSLEGLELVERFPIASA